MEFAATLDPKCKPTALVRKGSVSVAAGGAKESSWRDLPVSKRLEHALIKVPRGEGRGSWVGGGVEGLRLQLGDEGQGQDNGD